VVGRRSKHIREAIKDSNRPLIGRHETKPRDYKLIGSPVKVFGSYGSGEGQFDFPLDVVVDEDNIIVCDYGNRRIQMFDEEGYFIRSDQFSEGYDKKKHLITAASIDRDGNIVMIANDSHEIIVFDPNSRRVVRRFGRDIKIDGEKFSPEKLCIDHLNRIIVSDAENNRILIFDHLGNHLLSFGSVGEGKCRFNFPSGVAVNSLNNIIVCDTRNHRIQMLDEKGKLLSSFGSKGEGNGLFDHPYAVAVDHHDNIIVSDTENHRIQVFNPRGKWIKSFGSKGEGKGQFIGPRGITVDHLNRIIICDTDNHRIQIF